jgi:hypothetical protein
MVADDALQPFGDLLAELFRELCRIAKIPVIDEVGRLGEGGRLMQVGNPLVFQDLTKFGKR